jgi:sugar phosphate permease
MSEWISWTNAFYMVGVIIAGIATLVATKYKNIVKEMGDVAKKLEEGYKDGKLTKQEKDAVMKEVIDVMKSVLKAKWGLF